MSIPHIEDLDPVEFLHVLKNLLKMRATEKLDGANMVIGLNENGYLYTSREAKGHAKRCYIMHEWSDKPYDNPFRNAHAIVYSCMADFYSTLKPGDQIEVEVLFGRQPNAVVYGDSRIVYLRTLEGDEERAQACFRRLMLRGLAKGHATVVASLISDNQDQNIKTWPHWEATKWLFSTVPTCRLDKEAAIQHEIGFHEEMHAQYPPENFPTKKALREFFKNFQLKTKEQLLEFYVRRRKPEFRNVNVNESEDFGIEGLVLLDTDTGKQYKIVDKGTFTLINQFNHSIRNQIKRTSYFNQSKYEHLFTDFVADVGYADECIYDKMLARIGDMIAMEKLGKYMQLTRTIKKHNTMTDFVNAWGHQNLQHLRDAIAHIISDAEQDLYMALRKFTNTQNTFKLVLNDGRTIRYTDAIIDRTLLVFATVREELTEMRKNVLNANSLEDLARALYGKSLDALT